MTVPRFECTDRNIVSVIQRETMMNTIDAIYPIKGITLNIGGPPGEWKKYSLNVDCKLYLQNSGATKSPDIWCMGERLCIRSNSISKVYSCHSLEHMLNAKFTMIEWIRVLKPGGLLVIIVPVLEHHKHDHEIKTLGDRAPAEHTTEEFKEITDDVIKRTGAELLMFNTRKNNFDIDIVIKKKGDLPTQLQQYSLERQTIMPRHIFEPILDCPICRGGNVEISEDFSTDVASKAILKCKSCGTLYTKGHFVLDDEGIKELWRAEYGNDS